MDIKELFGDKSLTYSDFEKLAYEKKSKFIDLSEGGYVDKHKLDDKITELGTANDTIKTLQETVKKFDGVDVEKLKNDLATAETKYQTDLGTLKRDSAVNLALLGAKARDVKAVHPFLDLDTIKLDGDKVMGLDEQLQKLKTEKAFLFDNDTQNPAQSAARLNSAGEHHDSPDAGMDSFVAAAMKGAGVQTDNGGK
ncbi:MAG: phage scaffolding protein [Clostridium sp.]|jgi:hypothetical protein|uniref:phage scaffolding protein n=1 Tax=Clostridium sp. TaxID=1506 RepID=UPI0029144903|nr:phage scaffolding protein [Clostridium sp.]MDU7339027.1 phage scaffolding protein [Clostridium sp.]